jgi:GMP synthase (glutamine-hydrolysing)
MKLHYLQHVPFENLANIEPWAIEKGFEVTHTALYLNDPLPPIEDIDWLVILGGPMNVYEETEYTWLKNEKEFIKEAIEADKVLIGICFGAQLIAEALGSRIYPNTYKEIGWFPVCLSNKVETIELTDSLPEILEVFHWHGDTFELPPDATLLASNTVTKNQAFVITSKILGLQFHLEYNLESVQLMLNNCHNELKEEPYIQSSDQIISSPERFKQLHHYMEILLNNFYKINTVS